MTINNKTQWQHEVQASEEKLKTARTDRGCPRSHSRLKCCKKIDYITKQDGLPALDASLKQTVFSTMDIYQCPHHGGVWHLGHNRHMQTTEILLHSKQAAQYLFKK